MYRGLKEKESVLKAASCAMHRSLERRAVARWAGNIWVADAATGGTANVQVPRVRRCVGFLFARWCVKHARDVQKCTRKTPVKIRPFRPKRTHLYFNNYGNWVVRRVFYRSEIFRVVVSFSLELAKLRNTQDLSSLLLHHDLLKGVQEKHLSPPLLELTKNYLLSLLLNKGRASC